MQSRNNVEISILGDNLTQDIIEYKKKYERIIYMYK